ncbi:MAG: cyanophycin synthetase [Gammaproteobacteria bacterium]|nr:cyanophycin synthetase [Gammaproteobacteria bacterium]
MRRIKALLYAWISKRYMRDCTSYNSLEVRKNCRSKAQARAVFAQHGVPHARGMVFFLPWRVGRVVREHGFPLVVKPNVSGYSRGSYFPVRTRAELWRGILLAKAWWPTTVVEQYLSGANYRVLCTGEKLLSVIRRYPPFVTGNGADSIGDLIDRENHVRADMKLHPVMHPIAKSAQVLAHLKKSGRTLATVPADGEYVELFHRVALAPGGVVETIDKSAVAADNAELCMRVVQMFGANLLGIDVIFEKGIERSHKTQRCIFIEVNSRPYAKMHDYPRYGKAEDLSAHYAELDRLQIADADIF